MQFCPKCEITLKRDICPVCGTRTDDWINNRDCDVILNFNSAHWFACNGEFESRYTIEYKNSHIPKCNICFDYYCSYYGEPMAELQYPTYLRALVKNALNKGIDLDKKEMNILVKRSHCAGFSFSHLNKIFEGYGELIQKLSECGIDFYEFFGKDI